MTGKVDQHEVVVRREQVDDRIPGMAIVPDPVQQNDRLPAPALMVLNKAIAFRLLGRIGTGTFAKLGRGVPLVGGLIGGGVDVFMLGRIAEQARKEFPPVQSGA